MRKTYKKIIALCAVLIFALALISVQSFAIGDPFSAIAIGGFGGASGAGLFGAMASASGLDIGFPSGTTSDPADALWNSLNPDHVYFSGEKGQVTEPDPVTGIPTVYDYISVDIGDWLQAQNDFISEFVTNYNVTDNSSDSISVSSSIYGVPLYEGTNYWFTDNLGTFQTQDSFSIGPMSLQKTDPYTFIVVYNGQTLGSYSLNSYWANNQIYFRISKQYGDPYWVENGNYSQVGAAPTGVHPTRDYGYSANWQSSTLNLGVFDGYTVAKVKIPASSWSPSDPVNWSVQELLEELTYKMLNGAGDDIIIEDDSPVPPPVPVPTTPLGDIPTDEWYDLFGLPVLEGQEEIHHDLQDFSDSVSDGIDDVIGELEDIESDVESIDTNIGIGNGLLGDLKTIGQSIQSTLSSILSGVTDLVQEIVLSTETFIAGLLNSIIGGLGGMFSTMREAFSIWHYVVEWVSSISTVFSWFWSVAGSTSYYIQLPIYASLAGAVVLAFYKRFGK